MIKKFPIYVDNKKLMASEGESVLEVALRNGIDIPHFCYHPDLPAESSCRACLVETESGRIETSCSLKCHDGLKVKITDKVKKLRTENMELLLAGHLKNCPKCKEGLACHVAEKMKKFKVSGEKYARDYTHQPKMPLNCAAEFDPKLCIACGLCVKMCQLHEVGYLKYHGHDSKTRISCTDDPKVDCIYCGQCTVHCPTGAMHEHSHLKQVENALKQKNKIVIVQTAPSVRVAIGEEFGINPGVNLERKLNTAYRKLGFDKIFDVNFGADVTTMVEAEELAERLHSGKNLPMFTSCCPGWVKFVEFYKPKYLKNLTTSRSPQIHSGGIFKTYWAEKNGIDPKNIIVVSTMPCTSKKYEASHEKLKINGMKPVDFVLTTRELATLLKKNKIDLPKLKPSAPDQYGEYSGAAVIYGASGGVMESALRTAYFMLTGKDMPQIDFLPARGMKGVKTATVKIGKKNLKIAVIATIKNVRKLFDELEKSPHKYDYIEVMACPGGCLGGGGQPAGSTLKDIAERTKGIYKIDKGKKKRRAHENPLVQEFFEDIKSWPKKKRESVLFTSYGRKERGE